MFCVVAQLTYCCIVYPSVLITYLGQAAFLMKNPNSVANTFYDAIPDPVYWPMFVISTLAAIVASQVCLRFAFLSCILPCSMGLVISCSHVGVVFDISCSL